MINIFKYAKDSIDLLINQYSFLPANTTLVNLDKQIFTPLLEHSNKNINIIVIGDEGSGKSSVLNRLIGFNLFPYNGSNTIKANFIHSNNNYIEFADIIEKKEIVIKRIEFNYPNFTLDEINDCASFMNYINKEYLLEKKEIIVNIYSTNTINISFIEYSDFKIEKKHNENSIVLFISNINTIEKLKLDLDKQTKKYLILTFSDSIINLEKIDKIIGSNIVNQFKGCFCLKNNSKFEHEIEIYNTYRNELIFFKSNEYSKPFLGITSLLEKIIDNVKEYYFINIPVLIQKSNQYIYILDNDKSKKKPKTPYNKKDTIDFIDNTVTNINEQYLEYIKSHIGRIEIKNEIDKLNLNLKKIDINIYLKNGKLDNIQHLNIEFITEEMIKTYSLFSLSKKYIYICIENINKILTDRIRIILESLGIEKFPILMNEIVNSFLKNILLQDINQLYKIIEEDTNSLDNTIIFENELDKIGKPNEIIQKYFLKTLDIYFQNVSKKILYFMLKKPTIHFVQIIKDSIQKNTNDIFLELGSEVTKNFAIDKRRKEMINYIKILENLKIN